jgi:hypothetical protein
MLVKEGSWKTTDSVVWWVETLTPDGWFIDSSRAWSTFERIGFSSRAAVSGCTTIE